MKSTRREALTRLAVVPAAAFLSKGVLAMQAAPPTPPGPANPSGAPPAYRGDHAVVPLPFDPKSLRGISEKMIVSHHDNNYAGAAKNLNKVELALGQLTKESPPFVVAGLKERQLTFSNSVTLHELYFGNLGGDGKASGAAASAAADAYGGAARFEEEFRATGASLGGGSGWVVLGFDLALRSPRISWSGGHSQARASSIPLLVMDMYEHAYQIDYGAGFAAYIDAFFANVNWDEVDRRLASATKAAAALAGAG